MTGQHRLAVLSGDDPAPWAHRRALRRLVEQALGEGPRGVPWLLLGAALLYMAFLLGRFGHILSAVNWSSDAAFWPVLVEHLPPRGAGVTNLGNTPHYMTILFLALTRALPGHRTIWAWTPLLTSLAGVALIAWAARRAFGRRGAWLTLCVGACGSFPVVQTIVPQGVRSWTWLADAVMGAALVGLASLLGVEWPGRHDRRAFAIRSASVVGTTVVAGLTIASDPLFLVAGLGPFVVAAGATWLLHRDRAGRRLFLVASGISAGGLALAPLVAAAMASRGFRWTPVAHAFTFASYDVLLRNTGWLGEALLGFGNGLFFSRPIGLVPAAMLASSAIGLGALVLTLTRAGRMLLGPSAAGNPPERWSSLAPAPTASGTHPTLAALPAPWDPEGSALGRGTVASMAAGRPAAAPASRPSPAQTAHVAYWSLSAVLVMGVYVVGTIPSVGGLGSSRYLVPVFYAVAALLPLCIGRSAPVRMTAVAAAALFCVVGITGQDILVAFDRGPIPLPRDGRKVIAFLEQEGLTRGYAGYWDSHSITWHDQDSGGRATVYPVGECEAPSPPSASPRTLCPFALATSTSWYHPQPGMRTFVVTGGAGPPSAALAAAPPQAFGPPVQAAVLGTYSVFVYDYDVASQFGSPAPPL